MRAAAKALAAPTEAECGLTVDPDVAAEQQLQRTRCAAYLRGLGAAVGADAGVGAGVGGAAVAIPADASLLPAQLAVASPGTAERHERLEVEMQARLQQHVLTKDKAKGELSRASGGSSGSADGDADGAPAGRQYAVEMYGLRKQYKVSTGARWQDKLERCRLVAVRVHRVSCSAHWPG